MNEVKSPFMQQSPDDGADLISRQDAIDAFRDVLDSDFTGVSEETPRERIESILSAEPKTGEWIDWLGKGNEWECSVCKCSIESHGSIAYRYCPMCGADMRGEDG